MIQAMDESVNPTVHVADRGADLDFGAAAAAAAAARSRSPVVEVEVCAAVSDVLHGLGFTDFVIRLNHRGLLRGMLDSFGVPATLHDQALVAVDKLDKIGRDGVAAELTARGVEAASAERLLAAYGPEGDEATADRAASNLARLIRAQLYVAGRADGEAAVANLREIVSLSGATQRRAHVLVDPSLARGLSYYTGAIMEIAVPRSGGKPWWWRALRRAVVGMPAKHLPACGFSLGLERILGGDVGAACFL